MTDDLERARQRRERRKATAPAGAFGPSSGKQIRIRRVLDRADNAAARRADYYDGKVPVPERITLALDWHGLEGPEVDRALGGEEPMVDEWESGVRMPSLEQVRALAEMTGYSVRFFYLEAPSPLGNGWICGTDGCAPLGSEEGSRS